MTNFRTPMELVGDRYVNITKLYNMTTHEPNGCIIYTGPKNNCGYGLFRYIDAATDEQGMMTVHRIALMLKLGRPIAPGMNANHQVCHRKDCINPDHISEGTQREKIHKMIEDSLYKCYPGAHTKRNYSKKQKKRKYKWSDEEIQMFRHMEIHELADVLNLSKQRAASFRCYMRTAFKWLPYVPKDK